MGAEFRDSRRMELGISILSDFEAVWVQHVTGSNARMWYLKHFEVCLRHVEAVMTPTGPDNGHITRLERPKMCHIVILLVRKRPFSAVGWEKNRKST